MPFRSITLLAAFLANCLSMIGCGPMRTPLRPPAEERLSFQAYDPWNPRVNVNADVAMVYGIDESLPKRLESWTSRGYAPHVMTGVSWGEYQDYVYGKWDGSTHTEEIQTEKSGAQIAHGKDVFYMSPGERYGEYLCVGVKRALDAGATAIHLEEPEYWVRAGWEENFKREWLRYYNEPWIAPDSSPDAQYRASKLKYHLYRRALKQVFDFVRDYGRQHGRKIACYVPTHSLINYAHWGIVSPESSLMEVGCDGYIAQVWTGTARTPNYYAGEKKERTFETAFLEYGVMQNLVRGTDKRMWFLNDPIEDNPRHSWFDYRTNWENTMVASLLQPDIWRYEVMPWPHRIFEKPYPVTQPVRDDTPRVPMPKEYETELQAVISAVGDMKQPSREIEWYAAGTKDIGVLVSDTMMFQRFGPGASDGELGSFYGLALPLLMRGMPVEPVQIETADLARYRVLLLTYEGQKPPKPEFHDALARWVRAGGSLVVIDDDKDPYHAVREWWNSPPMNYRTPRRHLFDTLAIERDREGLTRVGQGAVMFASASPAQLSRSKDGGNRVRGLVRVAMDATGVEWKESNALVLRRGPYVISAGLERDSSRAAEPFALRGKYISLFDPALPVRTDPQISPGDRALFVDIRRAPDVGVIAAACRVLEEAITNRQIVIVTDGIEATNAVVCVKLPRPPKSVRIDDAPMLPRDFEYADGILRLRYVNHVKPTRITIVR